MVAMPILDLVAYVQEQTQEGVSAQTLRESLMAAGWQERDIENAFHDVAAGLYPATPGASIHEDLAQVRSMVAHLASRVKYLESTFIGPERELTASALSGKLWRIMPIVVMAALAFWLGMFVPSLVSRYAFSPADQTVIGGALGFLLLVSSLLGWRWRRAFIAEMFLAAAIALWMADTFVAWYAYQFISATLALALGALFLALPLVIGRRLDRLNS